MRTHNFIAMIQQNFQYLFLSSFGTEKKLRGIKIQINPVITMTKWSGNRFRFADMQSAEYKNSNDIKLDTKKN